MSRDRGFVNCDISTAIAEDAKFKRLSRAHQGVVTQAFAGYVGIVCASWRTGDRLQAIDGWPGIIPYSDDAVADLQEVGLLDAETRIPEHVWEAWYGIACERRDKARARYTRYNEGRPPRGSDVVITQSPVLPSDPSDPSVPSLPSDPTDPPVRALDRDSRMASPSPGLHHSYTFGRSRGSGFLDSDEIARKLEDGGR
jgi:hypothetical protein